MFFNKEYFSIYKNFMKLNFTTKNYVLLIIFLIIINKNFISANNINHINSTAQIDNSTIITNEFNNQDEQFNWNIWKILLVCVASLLAVVTGGGNVLVIQAFRINKQLRTISNYFLLSLAIADLTIGFISIPIFTAYFINGKWLLGPIICDLWLCIDYTMSNASVANLLLISFDRYFSITRPLTYRAKRTAKKATVMIAIGWLVSFFLWTPIILSWPYIYGERTIGSNECRIQFIDTNKYVTVGTAIIAFYLPVTVMCILYFKIWRETVKRQKEVKNLQAQNTKKINLKQVGVSTKVTALNKTSMTTTFLTKKENEDDADDNEADDEDNGISSEINNNNSWSIVDKNKKGYRLYNFFVCFKRFIDKDDNNSPSDSTETSYNKNLIIKCKNDICQSNPNTNQSIHKESKLIINDDSIYTIVIQLPLNSNKIQSIAQPLLEKNDDSNIIVRKVKITQIKGICNNDISSICENNQQNNKKYLKVVDKKSLTYNEYSNEGIKNIQRQKNQNQQLQQTKNNSQRNKRQKLEKKQDQKAAKTLSAILLAFIITWTPYNINVVLLAFCNTCLENFKLWESFGKEIFFNCL